MIVSTSTRFLFDSFPSAVLALLTVLQDARITEKNYTFSGLDAKQIRTSGLVLTGDISDISAELEKIPGAVSFPD
jgi:hypothetical protein